MSFLRSTQTSKLYGDTCSPFHRSAPGHHQGGQERDMVSCNPWKARFEERYGSEGELLSMPRSLCESGSGPRPGSFTP